MRHYSAAWGRLTLELCNVLSLGEYQDLQDPRTRLYDNLRTVVACPTEITTVPPTHRCNYCDGLRFHRSHATELAMQPRKKARMSMLPVDPGQIGACDGSTVSNCGGWKEILLHIWSGCYIIDIIQEVETIDVLLFLFLFKSSFHSDLR